MVAPIGKIASPSQGVGYFEKDDYYTKDDPTHPEASASWAGRGAEALGLAGPVGADAFRAILEVRVPGGRQLGRKGRDGNLHHRPGRDVTLSAPKSVSLMALVGGRRAHRRCSRRCRGPHACLGRAERRRDPDAGRGDGDDGPGRGPEDGRREFP